MEGKVYVLTQYNEYENDVPSFYVVGVYDTPEKAKADMLAAYNGELRRIEQEYLTEGDTSVQRAEIYDMSAIIHADEDEEYCKFEIVEREII